VLVSIIFLIVNLSLERLTHWTSYFFFKFLNPKYSNAKSEFLLAESDSTSQTCILFSLRFFTSCSTTIGSEVAPVSCNFKEHKLSFMTVLSKFNLIPRESNAFLKAK
jgi:hypothetical protein